MVVLVDDSRVRDELLIRYLDHVRLPVYEPPIRPSLDGPAADLAELVAEATRTAAADLEAADSSRRLVAPPTRPVDPEVIP